LQALQVHTAALKQGTGAVVLVQHRCEQVQRLNVAVVTPQSQRLGITQGFLELGR